MASVHAWQPEPVAQFSLHAAPKAALASLFSNELDVLAQTNRLTSHEDFLRVTQSPIRSKTKSLAGYLLTESDIDSPKIGFIVSRAIGGSVKRHRVTRQLRHASKAALHVLPKTSLVVVRATRSENPAEEISELFGELKKRAAR
ncbi:MAG: ribonuclease P protein component [Actinobacteria bacterium]|nr:ribonuclease P protein component [Actinomycetota bacterium]